VTSGEPFHWQFNTVTGATVGDDARLTHDAGGELWVRGGRLSRGAGYAEAPRPSRHDLARAGAILRLRRRGRYHIHASGVVDPAGRAWILTGTSGSGKSTMAYALARRGWSVLGDDGVILEQTPAGVVAYPWREALKVSVRLGPEFPELAGEESRVYPGDPRDRLPMHLSTARRAPVVALLCLAQGPDDTLTPIPAVDALIEVVRQSAWVFIPDADARTHLDALRRIVQSVATYRLIHSPRQLHAIENTLMSAAG
jgi:hypothetical protein